MYIYGYIWKIMIIFIYFVVTAYMALLRKSSRQHTQQYPPMRPPTPPFPHC